MTKQPVKPPSKHLIKEGMQPSGVGGKGAGKQPTGGRPSGNPPTGGGTGKKGS
jgi:hypothetical protein